MAANQLIQTHIDPAIGKEAASVLESMGLSLADAVRLMLIRTAQDHALPFDPLIPNAITIAAMKEADQGSLSSFDSIQALMDDLHAED